MEDKYFKKYLKYKNKYNALKKSLSNVDQLGGGDKKDVFLFKADWCPHCQGFIPTWEKLQNEHGEEYNFITYDGDQNKDEIAEWNVEGFPTIIVKKENEAMEYLGPNEYNAVLDFIQNI